MQELLKNYGDDENQEIDEVGIEFYLYKNLHAMLYHHQKDGFGICTSLPPHTKPRKTFLVVIWGKSEMKVTSGMH